MELCEVFVLGGCVGLGGPHKSTDLWVYVVWGCLCMPPILLNHLGSQKKKRKEICRLVVWSPNCCVFNKNVPSNVLLECRKLCLSSPPFSSQVQLHSDSNHEVKLLFFSSFPFFFHKSNTKGKSRLSQCGQKRRIFCILSSPRSGMWMR